MKKLFTIAALGILSMINPALADDLKPVLKLERYVGAEVSDTVTLYSTQIDPNHRSGEDRFELHINGKAVDVDPNYLRSLALARRAYAYDNFTGGINDAQRKAVCRMAGEPQGDVLSVRYLTYQDHKIVADEMRPVLAAPLNCLFSRSLEPKETPARQEAARALGALQALRATKN